MSKKESLSIYLPKLILTVAMLVSFGALAGAIGYLIAHPELISVPVINIPINNDNDVRSAIVGEDFLITLDANPSTGYTWTADFDKNYLALRSKDFVPDKVSPGTVGAGGKEVFTFAPIKAGETTITMGYSRPWESKAIETKVFKYNIKEKTVTDFYSCAKDSDCVSVKADCCGCTAGGKAASINKKYEDGWLNNLGCKDIMCPAVMSNDPSCINKIPKCENNKCVLASATVSQDICDIGKGDWGSGNGIFSGNNTLLSTVKQNCEAKSECMWKVLGGKITSNFACCPKDLNDIITDDNRKLYERCYMIID